MKLKRWLTYINKNNVSNNKMILVRLVVGMIFLAEGIQKYIFPELLGTGRFFKLGFSNPSFWAYFTGTFEIICGTLIILGFLTRLASIPPVIIMLVAFVTTKWPILINKGFWPFLDDYYTDFAMTLLLIYLLINGSGKWSVDSKISRHLRKSNYKTRPHERYRK
jgi:putative oxidoreductase